MGVAWERAPGLTRVIDGFEIQRELQVKGGGMEKLVVGGGKGGTPPELLLHAFMRFLVYPCSMPVGSALIIFLVKCKDPEKIRL